jgi:hypothetical protein
LFLSQNKRSLLTGVDERAVGIAKAFGFPLYDPSELERGLDFNFEVVRRKAQLSFETMQRFLRSLPQ